MKKLPITGLEVFLAIAERGSLRAAAASLGVQPPAVSYQLQVFEEQLGVSVFARTTRSLQLTDAGRTLLRQAQPAMRDLTEALEAARGVGKARKGTLRITLPHNAYQLTIAPRLAAFQKAYPEIELDLSFNEAFVDIVAERFHAGIRLGDRINAEMLAVRLTPPLQGAYLGAPAYFAEHGRPEKPQDLLRHNCIRLRFLDSGRIAEWPFQDAGDRYSVEVRGNLVFNSFRSVVQAACDGLGIGWSLRAVVEEELRSGRLESVLDRYAVERPGFFLYYPRENQRFELLRIFIDFMRAKRR